MSMRSLILITLLVAAGILASATAPVAIQTLQEYNQQLPYWGTSWSAGSRSANGYYPSFYTGFAMRSEFPERIHVRISRGNQTRVSVVLDDQTIQDYLFDLVKRGEVYQRMTQGGPYSLNPKGADFVPQLQYFLQILSSPEYGITESVRAAQQGQMDQAQVYAKALATIEQLNPGRVFHLKFDLRREFLSWQRQVQNAAKGDPKKITGTPAATVLALNHLLFGRVNVTEKPSAEVMQKLTQAVTLAVNQAPEEDMIPAALDLFRAVTGSKFQFQVLNERGELVPALQCNNSSCTLTYPEFTAIYPTGSMIGSTTDEFGNKINQFATTGLWQFLAYGGGRDVDNIRNEPYYGFIPKMDYEAAGNGFHNPAVRFWDPSKALKKALGIPAPHDTYWAVKRGGVSHGCMRLPAGSVWELRQILPVENERATRVKYFGNQAQDFDVYDINGDGQLEVMGVEYFISYGLAGTDDVGRREGSGLEINGDKKLEFYTDLYGANQVFEVQNGQFFILNPRYSQPSYLDFQRHGVTVRGQVTGRLPLFEQAYERDKLQFYAIGDMTPGNKLLVRLMGRVRGCSPWSDAQACGQARFEQEYRELVR